MICLLDTAEAVAGLDRFPTVPMVLPRLGQFSPQILEPENFGEPNATVATELL